MAEGRGAPQLVCPAGSLRALRLAVDAGADAFDLALKDASNARNFAGLNFDDAQVREGVRYAHARGREVPMALNAFADARDASPWEHAVDRATALGADVLIVADVTVTTCARARRRRAAAPATLNGRRRPCRSSSASSPP